MNESGSLLGFATPSAATGAPPQIRICFRIHEQLPWLLLPASVPSQLELAPVLAPVPNVKPWLRGVLNLRGNLAPVFDLGLWWGLDGLLATSQVLVVAPGHDAIAVLCIGQPSLLSVRAAGAVPGDDPMARISTTWFTSEHGPVYEFDAHAWLRQVGRQVPGYAEAS